MRAASVLNENMGNILEWRQLRNHPTLSATWNTSYANELGCLCQGIGTGPNEGKCVKGTNTLFPIPYDKIPSNRCRQIIYSKVVCKVRPEKGDNANRTRITIGGNNITYPGDVGTPTGSIELVKLLVSSVLSQRNARIAHDSWIYFEMRRDMYGLHQAGILANKLLRDRLTNFDYYKAATTPGLWCHKWRPVMFALIVEDFAIQYVGDAHLDHLCQALKKHYEVSEEIDSTRFAGMTLKWNYSPIHAKCLCRLSMPGYIHNVCTRYKHLMPTKRQLSPHKHCEIIFGQTTQLTHVDP
jgi:hypothetical protein